MIDADQAGGVAGEWLSPVDALTRAGRPAPLMVAQTKSARAVRFGYRVGSLGFLVGKNVLSEYLSRPNIFPIPNVHGAIRGYVNLQGALVAVWDIHTLLTDESHGDSDAVLVLGRGDLRVGVIVDGLPRTLKALEHTTRPSQLPSMLQAFVQEAFFGDDALWLEFDYEGFFRAQTEAAAA